MPRRFTSTTLLLATWIISACAGAAVSPSVSSPAPSVSALAPSPRPSPTAASLAPSLAPSPDLEGRLLFSRFNERAHAFTGMFTVAPGGYDELPVPLPSPEAGGRWSKSGLEIAVPTTLPDGRISTAILTADGTVLRVLGIPDPTLNVACTVWSPDDTRLACEGWDDTDPSRRGIYAVSSVDGSDLLRLTEPPSAAGGFFPGDISIDGQLVFKGDPGNEANGALWLVPLAGGQPVELTTESYEDAGRFSPDGRLVATSKDGQLVILDRNGAVVYQPDRQGRYDFGPDWSPDGDWIVFSSAVRGPFADLFVSRPDGSARYAVTTSAVNEIGVDWGREP